MSYKISLERLSFYFYLQVASLLSFSPVQLTILECDGLFLSPHLPLTSVIFNTITYTILWPKATTLNQLLFLYLFLLFTCSLLPHIPDVWEFPKLSPSVSVLSPSDSTHIPKHSLCANNSKTFIFSP